MQCGLLFVMIVTGSESIDIKYDTLFLHPVTQTSHDSHCKRIVLELSSALIIQFIFSFQVVVNTLLRFLGKLGEFPQEVVLFFLYLHSFHLVKLQEFLLKLGPIILNIWGQVVIPVQHTWSIIRIAQMGAE